MENELRPGRGLVIFAVVLFITAFLMSVVGAFGTFGIIENDPEVKHFFDWLRVAANHLMITSIASAMIGVGRYITGKETN